MISFIASLILLFVGYMTYGRLVEKFFGPDDRETPAIAINDGVDCIPIKRGRLFLFSSST